MQGLVYIFIALAALGVAATAYFGLTFSPIEALVTALAFGSVAMMIVERQLRQRAEARIERAVEDLARLLSSDAKAGQVLSQRVNAIADTNVGTRLDGIEADISVLGTVVRQVAEAVAEIDEARRSAGGAMPAPASAPVVEEEDRFPEPAIPLTVLRTALDNNRLVFHIEPVVVLPQRRPLSYDLVPRLMLDDGSLADAPDFMPRHDAEDVRRRIETLALDEAITVARRARTAGQPIRLGLALGAVTLLDKRAFEAMMATLNANQAVTAAISLLLPQSEWKQLGPTDKRRLFDLRKTGVGFVLVSATSLRVDFAELQALGFSSLRFDAMMFLRQPASFTDFHTADIAPYARRFEIDLCATGVIDEQQLLSLFEDGISLAQGPHIGRPGPVRPDLVVERLPQPVARRGEALGLGSNG